MRRAQDKREGWVHEVSLRWYADTVRSMARDEWVIVVLWGDEETRSEYRQKGWYNNSIDYACVEGESRVMGMVWE